MTKSKKSSKNKKLVVIFLYGPIAVGKLTVARVLSKKLRYKLVHNHLLNDFLLEFFDRHSREIHYMKDTLQYALLESMVGAGVSVVATHTYGHNFVSLTGLSDPKFVKEMEKRLTKAGAEFFPVHLKAGSEELLRRVSHNSRKEFKKLLDKKIMSEYTFTKDWETSPKLKNNLIIDNTDLSPEIVANMIIKHFKLRN